MKIEGPAKVSFPVAGNDTVEEVRFSEPENRGKAGRVWINEKQYFAGIKPEVWNFHIGGYQTSQRWLLDRHGVKLTYDDLSYYRKVLGSVLETLRQMNEIEMLIQQHGRWPLS